MKKLQIDFGIEEFEISNGKVLRFNPSDINVYNRLMEAQDKILAIEERLVKKAGEIPKEGAGAQAVKLLAEADAEMKAVLQEIFGGSNDFESLFEGVNLMAPASNGERVITNFLEAITPIIEEGSKKAARDLAKANAGSIKGNREQRRARK